MNKYKVYSTANEIVFTKTAQKSNKDFMKQQARMRGDYQKDMVSMKLMNDVLRR